MSPQEKRDMLATAGCNPRTLERWLRGQLMRERTKQRLDAAAKSLGLYKERGDRPRVKNAREERRHGKGSR